MKSGRFTFPWQVLTHVKAVIPRVSALQNSSVSASKIGRILSPMPKEASDVDSNDWFTLTTPMEPSDVP